jgi:hypothetical protein
MTARSPLPSTSLKAKCKFNVASTIRLDLSLLLLELVDDDDDDDDDDDVDDDDDEANVDTIATARISAAVNELIAWPELGKV